MNISFVIITDGKEPEKLWAAVNAIRSQGIPTYEIIIVGNTGAVNYGPHTYKISRPDLADAGNLGAMRNLGCRNSQYEILAVIDDDIILQPGWYEGLLSYPGEWDVMSCKIRNPDGSRYWDWKAFKDGLNWLIGYDEHPQELSLTGGLTIMRRQVFEVCQWPEDRGFNEKEDVDFSERLKRAGMRIVFNRKCKVVHDAPYTQVGVGVFRWDQIGGRS